MNITTAAPSQPGGLSNVVKLSKPIATHSGNTSELKFSPVTAELLIRNKKLPFAIKAGPDGTREVETDFALAARYIADLTNVDETLLGQLTIGDFTKCLNMLGGMLNDAGN